jgi:hypothetical protein
MERLVSDVGPTSRCDWRDDLIVQLADDEAALLEHLVDLTAERDAYRRVCVEAIHALHAAARELEDLRRRLERARSLVREDVALYWLEEYDRLVVENAELRAHLIRQGTAAA